MREFILKQILIEGFKSFRASTTINLSTTFGLKHLAGANKTNARLGANGAGKTACFDAVCWCWYGFTTRGHRAADILPNGIARASVTTTLFVDNQTHRLTRCSHPDRLTIDEVPATQRDFDQLLGLNRTAAMHAIIFAQATPLFFDLPVPARSDLLDSVLKLGYWLRLSELASAKANAHEQALRELDKDYAFFQGQLAALPDLARLRQNADDWMQEHRKHIEQRLTRLEKLEHARTALANELQNESEITLSDKDLAALRNDLTSLHVICQRYDDQLIANDKSQRFYQANDYCPTCHQELTKAFVQQQLDTLARDYTRTKNTLAAARKRLQEHRNAERTIEESRHAAYQHNKALDRKRHELAHMEDGIELLTGEITDFIAREQNPYLEQLEKTIKQRDDIRRQMRQVTMQRGREDIQLGYMNYWKQGFRRIRLFQMRRFLEQLTLETANAAGSLGLIGWRILFSTEIETKSGALRSGVHIAIDAEDSNRQREWSPGELQRVRLAVALGLAHLIQQMAGVVYRFEMWDEPTSWLSGEGIEDLLEQLHYRAQTTNRSIWLIDHRALVYSDFDEVWLVTKTEAGSTVDLVLSRNRGE